MSSAERPIQLVLKCVGDDCQQRLLAVHASGPALIRVSERCSSCGSRSQFEWTSRGWSKVAIDTEADGAQGDCALQALTCPNCKKILLHVHSGGPAYLETILPCGKCKSRIVFEWTSRGWRSQVVAKVSRKKFQDGGRHTEHRDAVSD